MQFIVFTLAIRFYVIKNAVACALIAREKYSDREIKHEFDGRGWVRAEAGNFKLKFHEWNRKRRPESVPLPLRQPAAVTSGELLMKIDAQWQNDRPSQWMNRWIGENGVRRTYRPHSEWKIDELRASRHKCETMCEQIQFALVSVCAIRGDASAFVADDC